MNHKTHDFVQPVLDWFQAPSAAGLQEIDVHSFVSFRLLQ